MFHLVFYNIVNGFWVAFSDVESTNTADFASEIRTLIVNERQAERMSENNPVSKQALWLV